jgi:lipopolysaccharide biosynthesis protein
MLTAHYSRHVAFKAAEIIWGSLFLTLPAQAIWQRLPLNVARARRLEGSADVPEQPLRLAVVAHVYYADLLPEVLACWANVEAEAALSIALDHVALHITTVDTCVEELTRRLITLFGYPHPAITLHVGPNRGRDIAPFIGLLNQGTLDPYDVVLKLHTKRSPHLRSGNLRRRLHYALLAGTTRQVRQALTVFSDPCVGMVGWALSFRREASWWMNNEVRVRALASDMTPSAKASCGFFEGSMFWIRPTALAPLRSLNITIKDFESEFGQIDGALHHAVERMFTVSAWAAGLRVCGLSGTLLTPKE